MVGRVSRACHVTRLPVCFLFGLGVLVYFERNSSEKVRERKKERYSIFFQDNEWYLIHRFTLCVCVCACVCVCGRGEGEERNTEDAKVCGTRAMNSDLKIQCLV